MRIGAVCVLLRGVARIWVCTVVATLAWIGVAAAQGNSITFSCAQGYSGSVCKAGQQTACTGTDGNNVDNLNITGVATGSIITFSFSEAASSTSPTTTVGVAGQGNTGNPTPSSVTVPPNPQPMSYTVTAADAADGQSDFQVKVDTNPSQGLKAAASYTVTCKPGTGKINLNKISNGGTATFPITLTPNVGASTTVNVTTSGSPNGTGTQSTNLTPATYTVSETPPAGWQLDSISCVKNSGTGSSSGTTVTLNAGDEHTCTVTNSKKGTIVVQKTAANGDGTTQFNFTGGLGAFSLTPPANGTVSQTFSNLTPGNFSVTETAVPGWTTTLSCTDPSSNTTTAGATANIALGAGETVTCTYTNTRQRGNIVVKKVTIGGDGNFSFTVNGPNTNQTFHLANGGQQSLPNLPTGQFTITETSLPAGWILQSASCGQGTKQNNTITVDLDPNENITCTFTNFKEKDERMEEVTKAFISRRVDNLLTHGPDRARLLRRLEGQPEQGLKDGPLKHSDDPSAGPSRAAQHGFDAFRFGQLGQFGQPPLAGLGVGQPPFGQTDYWEVYGQQADSGRLGAFSMLGASTNLATQFKFSPSLSELSASAQASEEKNTQRKLQEGGLGFQGQTYARPPNTMRSGLDLWAEGHLSIYEDGTGGLTRDGRFGIVYVGADYPISTRVLFGALAQFDWTKEKIKDPALSGDIGGDGWMAGPYIGVKLAPNLLFDARIAWGTSQNDVTLTDALAGTRTGSFDTTRWLSTATLTGNYNRGSWRLSPQAGLAYGNEKHDAFTNSLGQTVSENNISIGRFTLGSEVGYRVVLRDGSLLEPHIGLTGIWNFHSDDLVIDGVLVTPNRTRAKLESGVILRSPGGPSVRAAVSYDGIGDNDLSAVTGKVWLNVPFN
jgi:outer membrane autotransporter protein